MNLDPFNNELIESLQDWRDCFAYVVHNRKSYWILDWEAHFNLDQLKNFQASLRKGIINKERYEKVVSDYRGGVTQLTGETFDEYLRVVNPDLFSIAELKGFFFSSDFGKTKELSGCLEEYLSYGVELSVENRRLCGLYRALLPKFYINFDRKIFLHMYDGRMHDKVVNDGWYGAECDFEHMIPCGDRYWVRSIDEDLWAVTNISR